MRLKYSPTINLTLSRRLLRRALSAVSLVERAVSVTGLVCSLTGLPSGLSRRGVKEVAQKGRSLGEVMPGSI